VQEEAQQPLVELGVVRRRRRIPVIERVRLEHVELPRSGQARQVREARQDVQDVGPDRRGMAREHLAQHEVDDQERARRRERYEMAEAQRELALIARVVEHGAERRDDRERAAGGEGGDVARVEDVGALEPAAEAGMTSRRGLEELALDVGHHDVVAALERGRRQIAHAAADLEPAGADAELATVPGDGFPKVEGCGREVGGDLVGGDPEIVVPDLAPPPGVPHQPGRLTGRASSQRDDSFHGAIR